jgi:hypothetical protein
VHKFFTPRQGRSNVLGVESHFPPPISFDCQRPCFAPGAEPEHLSLDPYAVFAAASARRRVIAPIPPSPTISIALVEGSGTAPTAVVKYPVVPIS